MICPKAGEPDLRVSSASAAASSGQKIAAVVVESDETAAASAAGDRAGSAMPADNKSEDITQPEFDVTENLGASTSGDTSRNGKHRLSATRAENVDRIFAAGRDGKRIRSGYFERIGFRRARSSQDRKSRRPGQQRLLHDLNIGLPHPLGRNDRPAQRKGN
jgi:hypothetical protein